MHLPYPEFVLINIIYVEKALMGTEIVFVLTVFVLTRFYYIFNKTSTQGKWRRQRWSRVVS